MKNRANYIRFWLYEKGITMTTGKDIFNGQYITLNDGNKYQIKYGMYAISVLEKMNDNLFENIFKMFENYSFTNIQKALYAGIVTKHKDLRGKTDEEILDWADDLIDETNFMQVQVATLNEFKRFFAELQKNKDNLPEEYRKVLDEMEEKQSKKK